ncbi:MAG: polysaccharide deacetylase family protein [Desulforegulaceae bacterium]|nr:polysaccharide deacetylase family protein [Desulforegulaceae bacterium]
MKINPEKKIFLTFDVEDWFQVENFKQNISFSSWKERELRVYDNTIKVLDILDSFSFKVKGTFFILGWLADIVPELVKEIDKRGHEIASHGYNHQLCTNLNKKELLFDLIKSKETLESLINKPVTGYRAPSFAVTNEILETIKKAGYLYDSSHNNFSMHGRYGKLDISSWKKRGFFFEVSDGFYEIPLSNLTFGKKVIPLGGGGYFRLFPLPFFKMGMKSVLKKDNAFVFYAHPWEFDPGQPRVSDAPKGFKFRHYINLDKTEKKLRNLLNSFQTCEFLKLNTIVS